MEANINSDDVDVCLSCPKKKCTGAKGCYEKRRGEILTENKRALKQLSAVNGGKTDLKGGDFINFMAVDVHSISAGNKTATEIRAAYEPLNAKNDMFEYEVIDFIEGILELCGIEDTPTFKRAQVANQLEDTEMILAAADYLDAEAILKKLPWLSVDEADEILARRKEARV